MIEGYIIEQLFKFEIKSINNSDWIISLNKDNDKIIID